MKILRRIFIGGAIFLFSSSIMASKYYLYNSSYVIEKENNNANGSRMPERPLQIDVTNHIITVPNQLLGYCLTISSVDGKSYKTRLVSNQVQIPAELVGTFDVHLSPENEVSGERYYYGTINIE